LSIPFEFRPWNYRQFPAEIAECDLCLAPRKVEDDYERGHSLFKIGVFMAAGVPALAGPVPSYSLLLADGQAGSICYSLQDWETQLGRFLEQEQLRQEWSRNAKQKIRPYLTPTIAAQIDGLLRTMLSHNA
jgi:glycosyltransferase involved in cell wall biosynthesis